MIDDDYITPTLHDLLNILTLSTRNHTTILCNKIVFMEHVKPVFLEIYFHLSRMSRGLTSWVCNRKQSGYLKHKMPFVLFYL